MKALSEKVVDNMTNNNKTEDVVKEDKEYKEKNTTPITAKAESKAEVKSAPKKKIEPKKEGNKSDKPKDKKIGVLASILEIIKTKGPITKEDILKELVKRIPDREEASMKNTINAQIGGKNRPLRMEREKKITFVITDKGEFSIK